MLHAAHRTCAPSSTSVSIRTAVCALIWVHPTILAFFNGYVKILVRFFFSFSRNRTRIYLKTEFLFYLKSIRALTIFVVIKEKAMLWEVYLVVPCTFSQCHDSRHLLLGDLDLSAAKGLLIDVTHAEIREALLCLLDLLARWDVILVRWASCIRG